MRGLTRSRVAVAGAVAALATLGISTGSAAGNPPCSRAVAGAAIARVRPRIPSLASGTMVVTPDMADELICSDFTGDGLTDLAVTVASGGTAGDIGWVVLVQVPSRGPLPAWRVALVRGGYKLGLSRIGHDLADSQPVYRRSDPNCCPTGGFDHRRWHWNGRRFAVVRSWHTRTYQP
jgi:hypothetical protein